jgi:hypothetical protein
LQAPLHPQFAAKLATEVLFRLADCWGGCSA